MHRNEPGPVGSSALTIAVSVSFAFLIGVLWLGVATSSDALILIGEAVSATASATIMVILWRHQAP